MRIFIAIMLFIALTACGTSGDDVARDSGPSASGTASESVPPADGRVRSLGPAMVLDDGRPELCLGAIAESWPPQCGGPPIKGWDWSAHDGAFDQQGDVRWGEFMLTGTWDGTTFEVIEAIPPVKGEPIEGLDPVPPDEVAERLRHVVVDSDPDVERR